MYTIEKGGALPKNSAGRPTVYPFANMSIGDTFMVRNKRLRHSVAAAAYSYGRRHKGFKFALRAEGDGFRVYRVA